MIKFLLLNFYLLNNIKLNSYQFLSPIVWSVFIDFSIILFFIGILWLLLNWKNFLITLLCIELMYFGIVLAYIFSSIALNNVDGQIYALLLVILAAAESAIGLGVLVVLYRFGKTVDCHEYEELKG